MTSINSVNNSLLQSQLSAAKLNVDISYKVAAKTLGSARNQGAAVLELLDAAADMAKSPAPAGSTTVTLGAIASGLGHNLDVTA